MYASDIEFVSLQIYPWLMWYYFIHSVLSIVCPRFKYIVHLQARERMELNSETAKTRIEEEKKKLYTHTHVPRALNMNYSSSLNRAASTLHISYIIFMQFLYGRTTEHAFTHTYKYINTGYLLAA